MNQANAAQHGLPPLQQQQQQQQQQHHSRSSAHAQVPLRPGSPHRSHSLQSTPQPPPYLSPLLSTHSGPHQQHPPPQPQHQQNHSPYVGSIPLPIHSQHPNDPAFYPTHPGSYSTSSAPGSFASAEPNDSMATQAAMSRQHYPPAISSYQTPQSNSPASIHSAQPDAHGRSMYGMASMSQPLYYPYSLPQQAPYTQQPGASHQSNMSSTPNLLLPHQQQQLTPPQQQHHVSSVHPHGHAQSAMLDSKPSLPSLQRAASSLAPPQTSPPISSGPGLHSSPSSASRPGLTAAPGPIPATTPLVVHQDSSGVQWILFEYSRDRVKMEYTIRCDVESVNVEELDAQFKSSNCVYPRACCEKENYKGNRLHYESECNAVGWALAQLNPNLREKRGLIQRAVDSWRNSNADVRLRSRRVRRQAKSAYRKANSQYQGLTGSAAVQAPQAKLPHMGAQQIQHHHHQSDHNDAGGGGDVSVAGNDYQSVMRHPGQLAPLTGTHELASASATRHAHSFYPSYPHQIGVATPSVPRIRDAIEPLHERASNSQIPATRPEVHERQHSLFGGVPEGKQRKFILVDDDQRGGRSRVRVTLDQVNMDDIPDAHLHTNSVFPRSFYPRQTRSLPDSPYHRQNWDDEDDDLASTGNLVRRTMVTVPLIDGSDAQLPVPRMTKSRRNREIALNELGYRMSWGQARMFNGRTLFLQRSLNAYCNKRRAIVLSSGGDVGSTSPHLETRPGKRKWLERSKHRPRRSI